MQLNGGLVPARKTARRHNHVAQAREYLGEACGRRGGLVCPAVEKPRGVQGPMSQRNWRSVFPSGWFGWLVAHSAKEKPT